eukprot:582866-Pelagomonas_calceolata.AAC.1
MVIAKERREATGGRMQQRLTFQSSLQFWSNMHFLRGEAKKECLNSEVQCEINDDVLDATNMRWLMPNTFFNVSPCKSSLSAWTFELLQLPLLGPRQ